MHRLLPTVLLGLIAGVGGTGLGGLLTLLLGRMPDQYVSSLLSFAGGVMFALVAMDMGPSTYALVGPVGLALSGIVGAFCVVVIERLMRLFGSGRTRKAEKLVTLGALIGSAIGIHNLAEGMAIGAGMLIMVELGLTVTILVAVHNIPEGMAMSAPLKLSGSSAVKILVYTSLAGLPMALGAFLAAYFGDVSRSFLGLCLGFSSGAMGWVSVAELIPGALTITTPGVTLAGFVFGLMVGAFMIWAI